MCGTIVRSKVDHSSLPQTFYVQYWFCIFTHTFAGATITVSDRANSASPHTSIITILHIPHVNTPVIRRVHIIIMLSQEKFFAEFDQTREIALTVQQKHSSQLQYQCVPASAQTLVF